MLKFARYSLAGAAVAALALSVTARDAAALDKVRIAKSVATAFTFVPLDVGNHAGIWAKNGIELEIRAFRGASQTMQALTADTVEMSLGSGPALAFIAKGVPAKGVAAFAGPPLNMIIAGDAKANIRTIDDLKGKRIAVTSSGSLTNWLVMEAGRRKGWGAKGITAVPLGGARTQLAAMKRGQVDGRVTTVGQGYEHEIKKTGNIVIKFGSMIDDFITHVIYARNDMIANRPDVVRRVLVGWWQTIDYMKKNKAVSVDVAAKVMRQPRPALDKAYHDVMAMMTADGTFDPRALKTLSRSFVDLKILDKEPDMSKLFTTQFLPVKY